MKSRFISLAMIIIVLLGSSILTIPTIPRPKVAVESNIANGLNEIVSESLDANRFDSAQIVGESSQTNELAPENSTEELKHSQGRNVESVQTSQYLDGWITAPSDWSNVTCVDGNMTRLVVGVNSEKPQSYDELEKVTSKCRGRIVNAVQIKGQTRAAVVEVPLRLVTAFMEETRVAGLASYIEPSMKAQAQLIPNDPYWANQWGPKIIGADWAWNTTIGDPSVLVAVVDTGIDYTHPDLASNYIPLGYDWVNNDAEPMDDVGHGTHVSGIIAAVITNGIGIAGLAQVRVMAEKVLSLEGWGYWDWVAAGIIHAVDQGADVISMSLGGYGHSELVYEAVRYAFDSGVLIVAAAGNEDTNMKLYPAGYEEVVAVAATDQWDNKAWFSNWGDWIELAAPGVDIYSTIPGGGYMLASGTSMAAPHVSGIAALVWSNFPNKSRDWIRLWLRYTADDLGDPSFDEYYGYGRINARKAINQSPPAHDLLAYKWETPSYVEPASFATLNATVLNLGASNETEITLQLLANSTVVSSESIGFLASGETATVSLMWNPIVEGLYNVTFHVLPVVNETVLENNVLSKSIFVGIPLKVVVLQSAGNIISDIITNWQVLSTEWYLFGETFVYIDYTTLNKDDITYEDLQSAEADVLIISCAFEPYLGWQFTDSEIEAIERYVLEGHGLIATSGTLSYSVPNNNKLAPLFGLNQSTLWSGTLTDLLHFVNATHPVFSDVPNPFVFPEIGTACPEDGRWDSNELAGGKYLALGHYREGAIVAMRGLLYISPLLEIIPAYYHHHLQLLYNAIIWSNYQKPQHDLLVALEAPAALKPGKTALVNATVSNQGVSNETNVDLQLLINGIVVSSTTIPDLYTGVSISIEYAWCPTKEGTYNITAYVPPKPGEDNAHNNVKSVNTIVSALSVALFQNWKPWDYPSNEEALDRYGIPYVIFRSSDFGRIDLDAFSKVVLASDQDQPFYNGVKTYRWWFEDYVSRGGTLEIHAADYGWHGGIWTDSLPGGLEWASLLGQYVTVVDATHPLLTTPNIISEAELDYWNYAVHGHFSRFPADAHVIIIEDISKKPAYLELEFGEGTIIASSQTLEWAYWRKYSVVLENSLLYMPKKYEHDLSVSLEAPTFLEPNSSVLLNATVRNRGLRNESNVELSLLIDDTVVDSAVIFELPRGSLYALSYRWSPATEGMYNITAYVLPVPHEEHTKNNVFSSILRVRFVIARVAVLDAWEVPPYFYGGWANDYQPLVDALNAHDIYAKAVTNEEIARGILSFFDVFVMVDNVPSLAAVSSVTAFWSNGGGIVAFDSSICFLNYAGILPPESAGNNGFNVYWDYGTSYEARISIEHPVTAGYEVGQIVSGASGDAEYRVDALSGTAVYPDYTMLVEDLIKSDRAYVSAYEPPSSGKVVHIWDYRNWNNVDLQLMILNAMEWATAPRHDHDLGVTLSAASLLELGKTMLLNATVRNKGLNNETNIELRLMIDEIIVASVIIPELSIGGSYTLNHPWKPTVEGTYNITAYAPPIPDEETTANNIVTKMVCVKAIRFVLFDQTHGTDSILNYNTWVESLTEGNYAVDIYTGGPITSIALRGYDVFVIPQAQFSYTSDELWVIENFVFSGGGLLVIGDDNPMVYTDLTGFAGIEWASGGRGGVTKDITLHPVTAGVASVYLNSPIAFMNVTGTARDLIRDPIHNIMLAVSDQYGGKVIGFADEDSLWSYAIGQEDNLRLANNMIDWLAIRIKRDVAIVDVVPSDNEPLAGEPVEIAVVAENQGNVTESFVVSAFAQSLNSTRVYFDPYDYLFDPASVSIGYRFNVSLWIEDVSDLYAWQVQVDYDDRIINVTRWFEPTWDPSYVFSGKSTLPLPTPPEVAYLHRDPDLGTAKVASMLYPWPPPGAGFKGNGILCILEFEITAVPQPSETLSCALVIDNEDTELYNFDVEEIQAHKENGLYYLGPGAPPPPPQKLYRIGTKSVTGLMPGEKLTLNFTWSTVGVLPSYYAIYAEASVVPGENNTTNNKFVDGIIKIVKLPFADFTHSPTFPKPGETVLFNATASTPDGGTIVNYVWDFGDGNVTTVGGPIISHVYIRSGFYSVTLTILDSEGLTDSTMKGVYVFTRDTAIVDVVPSANRTYQGRTISVSVTIVNEGEVVETVQVNLYYNNSVGGVIGRQTAATLVPGEARTLAFLWDTTDVDPHQSYTITACSTPVLGETDIVDNALAGSSQVIVRLLGDINDDGKIDIRDVAVVALAFGSSPGHSRWNSEADLNEDGKVDIKDIAIIAKRFGQTTPPAPPECNISSSTMGMPDGKIDIRDIALAAKNFGKTAQPTDITTYIDTESNVIYGETDTSQ